MKKLLTLTLALLLLVTAPLALASCGVRLPGDSHYRLAEEGEESDYVAILVKGYGAIVVELYPDEAPITVANFKKLVKADFYEGTTFHRVIEDFMIQGGASAKGESASMITGEFEANNYRNDLLHERGVISMARYQDPYYNSASSQFFIVQTDDPERTEHLDGKYAAFGRVVEGMDVVDAIAVVETDGSDAPLRKVTVERICFAIPKKQ